MLHNMNTHNLIGTIQLCAACLKPVNILDHEVVWTSRCNLNTSNPLYRECGCAEHSECIDNYWRQNPLHGQCYDKGNY
jgi:hypothetical protein